MGGRHASIGSRCIARRLRSAGVRRCSGSRRPRRGARRRPAAPPGRRPSRGRRAHPGATLRGHRQHHRHGRRLSYSCPYGNSGLAPDVFYRYEPTDDMVITIDLCGSLYDTCVYLLNADTWDVIACNDDFYAGEPCGLYVSKIENAPIVAGGRYWIDVDGYPSSHGEYLLTVTTTTVANNPRAGAGSRPCTTERGLGQILARHGLRRRGGGTRPPPNQRRRQLVRDASEDPATHQWSLEVVVDVRRVVRNRADPAGIAGIRRA